MSLKNYRWTAHVLGYAYRWDRIDGQRVTVYLHREVMGLEYGDGRVIDHINGNKLDNRRENLRVLSDPGANAQNVRRSRRTAGSSKFRGVRKGKSGRWEAHVSSRGQRYYLGLFDREIDAAVAAENKRAKVMPFAEPDPELAKELARREAVQLEIPSLSAAA